MESVRNAPELSKVAEVELVYRNFVKPSQRPQVTSSKIAYSSFMSCWNGDKIELIEEFKVMLLNRNLRVLGIINISTGGMSGTFVDLKIIFSAALKGNACTLILAHNHPSGNLNPSEQDLRLTKRIREAGRVLDIEVNDHLIITAEGFYSFADEGAL